MNPEETQSETGGPERRVSASATPVEASGEPREQSTSTWDRVFSSASRKLYRTGKLIWLIIIGVVGWQSPIKDPILILAGLSILSLSIWPALLWARDARVWFPVFEIFMLTGSVFYALPLLLPDENLVEFENDTQLRAAIAVLLYQVCALATFLHTRGRVAKSQNWLAPLFEKRSLSISQTGVILNTVYLWISTFTTLIPWEILSITRAVFFGIGTISVFIQSRLWGQKLLSSQSKVTLVLNLIAQSFMLASQLYLINALSMLALSLIAYMTSSRRVPIIVMTVCLVIFTVLHNGKPAMRKIYWEHGQRTNLAVSELPAFFEQWIELGLQRPGERSRNNEDRITLMQRASLFQIIAVTVDTVPRRLPYLSGETYADIPALFIPRIFWPNKPTALDTNVRLALYFGLVAEYSAKSVSIAFGMLAEAYANFGFLGVCGLGAIIGTLFKRICVAAQHADLFSPIGLFVIILTAWSLQVEMVAATWLSSLFQASLVSVLGPMLFLRLIGRR